jgi:hypothetical protein
VLAAAPDAEVRAVERPDLYLEGPGETFHGRDRFAPVAAYLARGGAFAELGAVIDDPVRLTIEPPSCAGEPGRAGVTLTGHVAHVDRFGNLVTDVPSDWLGERPCSAEVGSHQASRRVAWFAAAPPNEPVVIPGSLGTLELALNGDRLARRWGAEVGDLVTIRLH